MKTKIKTAISIDKTLVDDLAKYRGLIPLSTYINDVLHQWIELQQSEEMISQ